MDLMFVRVVSFICKDGMGEEFKRIGRDVLVPVNEKAGCLNIYFLESGTEDDNLSFGLISMWEDEGTLNKMRKSESYGAVVKQLQPLIESVQDHVYLTAKER
jgi:quinol monooxygenase YgiN